MRQKENPDTKWIFTCLWKSCMGKGWPEQEGGPQSRKDHRTGRRSTKQEEVYRAQQSREGNSKWEHTNMRASVASFVHFSVHSVGTFFILVVA